LKVKDEILNESSSKRKKMSFTQQPKRRGYMSQASNQIDYKMLSKNVMNFGYNDFDLLERSIHNIQSFVPESQKGSCPPIS